MQRFIVILIITVLAVPVALAAGQPPGSGKELPAAKEQHNQTYDEPQMPIKTQYPGDMQVQGSASGEGCGFFFSFKPQKNALDQAQVHIFLPRGAATAAAHEPFVTGPRGLLKNNGWKKAGASKDSAKFPYAWVKKIISFSDPKNQGMGGKILLGEAGGQAVQVTLYYPAALSQEFLQSANVILGNLQFKSDKLPLGKSGL